MLTVEYAMRVIVTRDFEETVHELIETHLKTDYTVTGHYGEAGLEWIIEYRGDRDTTLLELALSEYIVNTADVDTVYEYRMRNGKGVW